MEQTIHLEVGCEIAYEASAPTPLCLMLRPRSGASQQVKQESYDLSPDIPVFEYTDAYGNLCQRMEVPAGRFVVCVNAQVETSTTIDVHPGAPFTPMLDLPAEVIQFLLPSRYCESDLLGDQARALLPDGMSGYDQVETIRSWIHTHVEYCYGTSTASTSAWETFQQQRGVCRDFAHLGIALCRSLDIPARIVVGYLYQLKPMDLHAWFEAFVGGRWYTFDATQSQPCGGRVVLGYGRDAADVAFAMQFGPIEMSEMRVWVNG